MKMSPLLVQGLWENSSPLLMLPHIAEQQLKYFVNKKVGAGDSSSATWQLYRYITLLPGTTTHIAKYRIIVQYLGFLCERRLA